MTMHVGRGLNIRLIDSVNFLPMKLSALPSSLGLGEAVKKGDFPHFFNTLANQTYVGPYPDPCYYGVDFMSAVEREKFLAWHAEQEGKVFDFRQEMLDYCRQDVNILRQACLKFRHLLLQCTGVDPLKEATTIAGACMKVYRSTFLEEDWLVTLQDEHGVKKEGWFEAKVRGAKWKVLLDNQWQDIHNTTYTIDAKKFVKSPIAQVPSNGYTGRDQYSKVSIEWLEWLALQKGVHIHHALNGGEFKVPGTRYRLDGYTEDPDTGKKTAYEFHGRYPL
jgi:hypothetical protein